PLAHVREHRVGDARIVAGEIQLGEPHVRNQHAVRAADPYPPAAGGQLHGHAASAYGTAASSTATTSNLIAPPGASTSTVSPATRPSSAPPIGDSTESMPRDGSPSTELTSSYSIWGAAASTRRSQTRLELRDAPLQAHLFLERVHQLGIVGGAVAVAAGIAQARRRLGAPRAGELVEQLAHEAVPLVGDGD